MAAQEFTGDAISSAAMSIALALVERVVAKGLMTKGEAIDMVLALADSKASKSIIYNSGAEAEASELLAMTAQRLDERLP